MKPQETANNYYAAIGEFIIAYSKLEVHVSKFISTIQQRTESKYFGLSVDIVPVFYQPGRATILQKEIDKQINTFPIDFLTEWNTIKKEIDFLLEARNYLVHGSCFGSIYYEPLVTYTRLKPKDSKLVKREFYVSEIRDFIPRTHYVTGKLTGDFWQLFVKSLGHGIQFITSIKFDE